MYHEYKATADIIGDTRDSAALVGVDEHQNVPAFRGEEEMINIEDRQSEDRMDVDSSDTSQAQVQAPVQMVIMDGIVMGPKHCAIEDCTADLVNY
jgi:hypothetical protein